MNVFFSLSIKEKLIRPNLLIVIIQLFTLIFRFLKSFNVLYLTIYQTFNLKILRIFTLFFYLFLGN
jgi:hypothetical protein